MKELLSIPIEEKNFRHNFGSKRNNIWASGLGSRRFAQGQRTTPLDEMLAIAEVERQALRFQWHRTLMSVIDQTVELRRGMVGSWFS